LRGTGHRAGGYNAGNESAPDLTLNAANAANARLARNGYHLEAAQLSLIIRVVCGSRDETLLADLPELTD